MTSNLWTQSVEVATEVTQQLPAVIPRALKKYGSLEEAIKTGLETVSFAYDLFMISIASSISTDTGDRVCCGAM